VIQNLDTGFVRRHELRQPRLHRLVPNLGFVLIGEAIGTADDFLQQLFQFRIALLIGAGLPCQGKRDGQREQHRQGVPHGATSAI
jgi:hypothetical protein